MTTRIIKIGNSQGIRLPKLLIDQVGLSEEVDLEVRGGEIVIRPAHGARHGWEEQFKAMAEAGDDRLIDGDAPSTEFESEEWEW
jgi:antitoxin MazE